VRDIEIETMFRILYWASYLGEEKIVESLIRYGFSPFVRSYEKKNSLMAALEGKKLNIIKLILSFTYRPTH